MPHQPTWFSVELSEKYSQTLSSGRSGRNGVDATMACKSERDSVAKLLSEASDQTPIAKRRTTTVEMSSRIKRQDHALMMFSEAVKILATP